LVLVSAQQCFNTNVYSCCNAPFQMKNVLKVLGLHDQADTLVGDVMIRGISGGQKRRMTLGEMLLPPRRIKFLDAISNGLDAATTYDIIQALKFITNTTGLTTVISLLQPAPDVFYSFTDVIVMADGKIIYHGLTTKVLEYFNNLGYHCPEIMDVADFLQEIPTPDGRRFAVGKKTITGDAVPLGTTALVKAWKDSDIYRDMLTEMDEQVFSASTKSWPPVFNERYPSSNWYTFTHCLQREAILLWRNNPFLKGRIIQALVLSILADTLQ
jgi:ABC-type multidrug transport system ATPase subunit